MKYGLKPYMADLTIEIVVCKWGPRHYEVSLSEQSKYSNDDLYNFQLPGSYTNKQSTAPAVDKLFAYLVQMGFYKVKRKYIDIS